MTSTQEVERDRAAAFRHLHAAQESLYHLDVLLEAGARVEPTLVRDQASAARGQVDEAVRLLAHGTERPDFVRVPCSFCNRMIMPAATLCGFCWHKRTPA